MEGGAKSVGGLPIVPRKGCLRLPSCEAEADSKQPVADADQVSLLSWNILADTLLQKNVREYAHIPEEWKDWGTRRCAIVDELVLCDADVICLQEVEFTAFETDLLPALEKVGYAGAMQNDKKRVQGHCQGVATFWKQSKLSEKARHSRSRTLMTLLTDSAGRNIAICNVHLEGHPMKSAARVKQLQNTLRDLSLKHNHQALVVAGDFNCQMQSSACGAYLSFGSCPAGVLEWGRPVPTAVTKVPPHTYTLSAAYALRNEGSSPGNGIETEWGNTRYFTYCQHAGRPVAGLDQLWFSSNTLKLVAERALFSSDEQRLAILKAGLPSPANFSDHIPIGAVLRWASFPDGPPNLRVKAQSQSGSRKKPTTEDPALEALQLLEACPITQEQRDEFELVTAPVPGTEKKCKPTPEQLVQIKDLRNRKEQLLAGVPEEAAQMLTRVIQLRRQARKQAKR
eukprot:INCI16422.13.p1 GENE.INCI16422.13~~INCI16422.13.p1  ORF type:complete len:454 (-),score=57.30 INCI16422.13:4074-5435(-)